MRSNAELSCERIKMKSERSEHSLDRGLLPAGPQPDARPMTRRRDVADVRIDAKIHPRAVEALPNNGRVARDDNPLRIS